MRLYGALCILSPLQVENYGRDIAPTPCSYGVRRVGQYLLSPRMVEALLYKRLVKVTF